MSRRSSLDGGLRVLAIALVIVLGLTGLLSPGSVLVGGLAWVGFLLLVLSGWGFVVSRLARLEDPDFGLRAVWGIAGYLAVSGVLIAAGICSRPIVLLLIAAGVAGFAWREVTTTVATWERARDAARFVRRSPAIAFVITVIGALALVHVVGAVAALDRNPWDDDLAYTPLIKRMLDSGDLVEPFSLRRLGAYGGQTALGALAGARGTLANVQLIDQGLCFALALLLVIGHARERRTSTLWLVLLSLVLVLMPNTAINTASYWSGAALFVALYRTVVNHQWAAVGLVGAATCTLRQSYLAVVVLLVAGVLLARLIEEARGSTWRDAWDRERRRWGLTAGIASLALLGWWIASLRSSGTFLFPLLGGTFNHDLSLKPSALTWLQELQFLIWCCIETSPLVVVPPLFAVLCVFRDARPGRPLAMLFIASSLGFLLLVHGFAGSEAAHLWRYAFGPAIALLAVLVIEAGSTDDGGQVHVPALGKWVVIACLLLQLVTSRSAITKSVATSMSDLREAIAIGRHGDPVARSTLDRYVALQTSIPAGARVAVMLDEPALLDFARNQIFNLDTPGYASPDPGLPSFEGAAAWRAYFLDHGIRYIAFVRPTTSRYFFRREFWVWRIFNDSELFQVMSAYTIDAIDTLTELSSSSRVLHDSDGLVAIDLGDSAPPVERSALDEPSRRGAFVRAMAAREDLADSWALTSREDVLFEDGFSSLAMIDDAQADDPAWFQITHRATSEPVRGTPVRWLFRRAHLRVRGTEDMRLALRGKVNLAAVHTRPRLDVSLDGVPIGSVVVDDKGGFSLDAGVSRAQLGDGWHDVYLVWSSVSEPQKDARDLRVARLLELVWEPLTGTTP